MITFLLATIGKSLFLEVLGFIRLIFGSVWTTMASKVSEFMSLSGVSVGIGIFDLFVGIDFIVWATGLSVTIIITIRFINYIGTMVAGGIVRK